MYSYNLNTIHLYYNEFTVLIIMFAINKLTVMTSGNSDWKS